MTNVSNWKPDLIINGVPIGAQQVTELPRSYASHRGLAPINLPENFYKDTVCRSVFGYEGCKFVDNGRDEIVVVTDQDQAYLISGKQLNLSPLEKDGIQSATLGNQKVVAIQTVDIERNLFQKAARVIRNTWSALAHQLR